MNVVLVCFNRLKYLPFQSDNKSSSSIGGFVVPPGSASSSATNTKAGTGYGVPFSYNIPVDDNVSKPVNYPHVSITS